ncbi:MAG TPA: alkaline phosphatase family protein [Edaphobacter sp.]|nr:alkaline phosphatase family protein [Edaphobacter sp.]
MDKSKPGLEALQHVIVLMMENRPFDHMLGGLKANNPKIDVSRFILYGVCALFGMAAGLATSSSARAQTAPADAVATQAQAPVVPATSPSPANVLTLSGEAHCGKEEDTKAACRLGDHLYVGFQNLRQWMENKDNHVGDVALVLNGHVMRGLKSSGPDTTYRYLRFNLNRHSKGGDNEKSDRATWNALINELRHDKLRVLVAAAGNPPYWGPEAKVRFVVLPWYSWLVLALLLLLLFFFIVLARRSDPSNKGVKQSYSLALCQMAWWFFLVAASYCYIWLVLKERDSITPSVLVLIGVSAATGLAATVVDGSKREQRRQLKSERVAVNARLNALAAQIAAAPRASLAELQAEQHQKIARLAVIDSTLAALLSPVDASEGFFLDILRDESSFHRFQMLAWTIILGIVFLHSVWTNLTMPEFSTTLLGLMGISSGTYLGFKLSNPPKDQARAKLILARRRNPPTKGRIPTRERAR